MTRTVLAASTVLTWIQLYHMKDASAAVLVTVLFAVTVVRSQENLGRFITVVGSYRAT